MELTGMKKNNFLLVSFLAMAMTFSMVSAVAVMILMSQVQRIRVVAQRTLAEEVIILAVAAERQI